MMMCQDIIMGEFKVVKIREEVDYYLITVKNDTSKFCVYSNIVLAEDDCKQPIKKRRSYLLTLDHALIIDELNSIINNAHPIHSNSIFSKTKIESNLPKEGKIYFCKEIKGKCFVTE